MPVTQSITVGAKKSRNYQTYEVTITVAIEKGDDVDAVIRETQAYCRKLTVEQTKLDMPDKA
jgi:hypothetical protein